jgi:hypothetical protein
MAGNDERFEDYLREFTPRAPGALPVQGAAGRESWRRWAAAAGLLLAVGTSLWLATRHGTEVTRKLRIDQGPIVETVPVAAHLTLWRLNQAAQAEPTRFDAQLAEESRAVLPDFRGEASTLRVLAKE